jgi:GNAT superfamily N-acetyltransferase
MEIREISADELDFVSAVCLDPSVRSEWREIMNPYMEKRKKWLKTMMEKGLRVLVAFNKPKTAAKPVRGTDAKGLVEYVPIEFACEPVKGKCGLFINCIWVVPPFWHRGVARALLEKCVENAKAYGGLSVLAYEGDRWFGFFPYMPASFFKKFGFQEVDRDGSRVLLHLDLGGAEKPKLIRAKTGRTVKSSKLAVDVFCSSQCPWSGLMVEKVRQNAEKYDAVVNVINTDDWKMIERCGVSRGVCINGELAIKRMASWKEVEAAIKDAVKR